MRLSYNHTMGYKYTGYVPFRNAVISSSKRRAVKLVGSEVTFVAAVLTLVGNQTTLGMCRFKLTMPPTTEVGRQQDHLCRKGVLTLVGNNTILGMCPFQLTMLPTTETAGFGIGAVNIVGSKTIFGHDWRVI